MNIIEIVIYATDAGKEPFSEWHKKLDNKIKATIMNRLDRVKLGNFGDSKRLQGINGVWELRIDRGPGYRIYFGKDGSTVIVLLVGGSKRSQSKDIAKAKQYWLDYLNYKELL